MIKNYFKTALRSLRRNRNYALINIAGLSAGIAVCLIIFVIIRFHSSFDGFHSKKDRVYRILTEYHHADAPDIFYGKGVPFGLPAALRKDFPQVEKVAAIFAADNDQILVLDDNNKTIKKFKEERGIFFTEPSLFDILDYRWLSGTPSVLSNPNSAVLSKETAEKYFGSWNAAMGRKIKWNNNTVLQVNGVLDNVPANSDLQFKIVIALGTGDTRQIQTSGEWNNTGSGFGCFVLLNTGVPSSLVNQQLRVYAKKMKSPDNHDSQVLESLQKVHVSTAGNFSGKTISPELIRVLWIIGAFILLIACVNFINLATAQTVNRSKEVGIRKVMGSNKRQLRLQFLTETFLIVFGAIALGLIVTVLALPLVSKMLALALNFSPAHDSLVIIFLLSLLLLVTLLAGFYPSVILSGFNPVHALKNKRASAPAQGLSLRRGLVVFQFIIAQALIIGTLIIVKQMNYFSGKSLGFDKTALVNIPFPTDSASIGKLDYLRKTLSGINGVQTISFSSNTPIEDNNDNWTKIVYDHAAKVTDFYSISKWVDDQYVPTYKLSLIAGRNLQPSDTVREYLVNESLANKLGITRPDQILNKEISFFGGELPGKVVGVLKDFHDRSFRAPFAPLLMSTEKKWYSLAAIKLSISDAAPAIKQLEQSWNTLFPDFVFEYRFLDDKIDDFYKQERQVSQLYTIFAAIAIFLSCLGLYGLASFMAVQRIREVGIRKVLGASASSIVYLFSKEFIALIAIAFLVAAPLAWYFMNQWLQAYSYRIEVSWFYFFLGGLASVIVAMLTVSIQAVKAAVANPINNLRTD